MNNSFHTSPQFASPSLLRRIAAMAYDTLLLTAVSILYGAMMTGINVLFKGVPDIGERINWEGLGSLVFIGWIATMSLFFCYFWRKSGQTLGMKTWRIKLYDAESLSLPSMSQCIIRCCCAPISFLLLGAGYWWMYLRADRQTLHDIISKTRVLLLEKDDK